ncbi:hypothetical protein Anas_10892 [Armadillidium nasatum]|uniref:Uncharacterized protein n=1 Tax=Armadillidium nasatum TaxID=96803 RepID=A0A5N5T8Q5_9CRUS|nr:hypothetical protein Anas_10892 [Armadillidium nasatum]
MYVYCYTECSEKAGKSSSQLMTTRIPLIKKKQENYDKNCQHFNFVARDRNALRCLLAISKRLTSDISEFGSELAIFNEIVCYNYVNKD